ncbi:MAG: DUF3857 domain-containing protein [Bdellovibrionota bacterium]
MRPLCFMLLFLFVLPAHSKIAAVSDLPFVVEHDHVEITVEADGRSRMVRDVLVRINNDQGRESQSVQSLSFNSRAQKFTLLEAATLNGPPDKVVKSPVPKKDVEIKETGELSQAFDSIKQVALSYPQVKVGSRLVFRYVIETNEIPLKNFWSVGLVLANEAIESFRFHVKSRLPLHHVINDLEGRLRIETSQKKINGFNEMTISSAVPLMGVPTQEEYAFFSPERTLGIWLSSVPDWKAYARDMIPVHQSLLSKPLPKALQEIRDKAALETTPQARIERVAALIAQEFRYFGDWRRRHGGYVPRSLQEIAASRYGDCKDLSLISTAIFRSLGFKADMAWIYRGEVAPSRIAYQLPIDMSFNHAISRVEADRVYWVDATNPVVFARGVQADIGGRPAFVLDPKGGRLEDTPKLEATGATDLTKLSYDFQADGTLKVDGLLRLGGRVSIGLTARAFYSPVETVNYDIIRAVSAGGKILESSVGGFDRGTRIVNDLEIPVKFSLADIGLRTSAGFGFPLMRPDVAASLLVETKDRASDLYLEIPGISKTELEIHGVRKIGRSSLDCDLKSEQANLKRVVRETDRGVAISDTVEVKNAIVPSEVLQSKEFALFQKSLRDCFNRSAVILERR